MTRTIPEQSSNFTLHARELTLNSWRFRGTDAFEGVADKPLTLQKYAYAGNEPVTSADPLGTFTLPELTLRVGVAALVIAVVYGGYRLSPFKTMVDLHYAKQGATEMDSDDVRVAVDYLASKAPEIPMVDKLKNAHAGGAVEYWVMKDAKYVEGHNVPGTNVIFIGETTYNHSTASRALAIFAEFQHSRSGYNSGDSQVLQDELRDVRRKFDAKDRADQIVQAIHHGGTNNEQ
jgi:hypothetical protein